MRIAQVVGTVVLSRCCTSFTGATLKLAVPLSLDDLLTGQEPRDEELVVYDAFSAGISSRIMLSEGGEAAQPFRPHWKPVDAYNAGLLDEINIYPLKNETDAP